MATTKTSLEAPLLPTGLPYLDKEGRLCETVESFYQKQIQLGRMVCDAVLEGKILLPTRLLSVPRGSLWPTDTVSRMLNMTGDQIISYGISRYNGSQAQDQFRVGQMPTPREIEGQVLLVVDEIADRTLTLERVVSDLEAMNPRAIYTAVIYDKLMPGTQRPDFAVAYTDHPNRWVVFPNESLEEYGVQFRHQLGQNQLVR